MGATIKLSQEEIDACRDAFLAFDKVYMAHIAQTKTLLETLLISGAFRISQGR